MTEEQKEFESLFSENKRKELTIESEGFLPEINRATPTIDKSYRKSP